MTFIRLMTLFQPASSNLNCSGAGLPHDEIVEPRTV
jgi:hypothetical protein